MLPFDAFSAAAAAAESSNQSQTDKQTDKLLAMTKREYYDSKRWLMFEQQKYRWEKVGNQQTDRQTQTQTQTSNWANITITQTVFFFLLFLSFSHHKRTVTFNSLFLSLSLSLLVPSLLLFLSFHRTLLLSSLYGSFVLFLLSWWSYFFLFICCTKFTTNFSLTSLCFLFDRRKRSWLPSEAFSLSLIFPPTSVYFTTFFLL